MPRSRLGPLALESPLGHPRSTVFRAVHVEQRTQLAVRVFPSPLGMTPEAKRAFAEQMEELKGLRHPGIVRCFGGGFDARDAYLVYELIDGESLDQILARRGRLPWETVLDYGLQLTEALQWAHEKGWVHGRIQLDKLLVTRDERGIKLHDFRRPTETSPPFSAERWEEDLAYAPPETWSSRYQPRPAGDLYRLGAVLYRALTGQVPYPADSPESMQRRIREDRLTPVASIVFDCPVWLSAIVEQMLEKQPNKRPFTAAAAGMAFKTAQQNALSGVGVAQHAISGFSPLQMKTDRQAAAKALGLKAETSEKHRASHATPITERPWFLVLGILLAVGVIYYFTRPLSESTLRARAQALMATAQSENYDQARDLYLLPLLERFPDGPHTAWAREQLDIIEMDEAERRMERNRRFHREPRSEGERQYEEAQRYERFGDRVTAIQRYRALVELMKDVEEARPYVRLAERQAARLEGDPTRDEDVRRFLEGRMKEADRLLKAGEPVAARKIWESIVTLYDGNQEWKTIVEQAQARLARNP